MGRLMPVCSTSKRRSGAMWSKWSKLGGAKPSAPLAPPPYRGGAVEWWSALNLESLLAARWSRTAPRPRFRPWRGTAPVQTLFYQTVGPSSRYNAALSDRNKRQRPAHRVDSVREPRRSAVLRSRRELDRKGGNDD